MNSFKKALIKKSYLNVSKLEYYDHLFFKDPESISGI